MGLSLQTIGDGLSSLATDVGENLDKGMPNGQSNKYSMTVTGAQQQVVGRIEVVVGFSQDISAYFWQNNDLPFFLAHGDLNRIVFSEAVRAAAKVSGASQNIEFAVSMWQNGAYLPTFESYAELIGALRLFYHSAVKYAAVLQSPDFSKAASALKTTIDGLLK